MADSWASNHVAGQQNSRYRSDIHGLRGVAIALVVLFHVFGDGRVSGGIDIFLALSGLLFTLSLLRRATTQAGLRWLPAYVASLALRLLPAALLVLTAIAIAAVTIGGSAARQDTLTQVRSSLLFTQNWTLITSHLSYSAAGPGSSPVQHFWSLSVQGQFFVLWPLLVLLTVVTAVRLPSRPRRLMGTVVTLVAMSSFGFALSLHRTDPAVAYFHTGARLWEMAVGGLAGLLLLDTVRSMRVRIVGGWLGLALIISSGFMLDGAQLFPGPATWWPLAGMLLVVMAGSTGSPYGVDRLLSQPSLRWLGDVAYPLYLWHWPVLIYATQVRGAPLNLVSSIAVIAGSLVLAAGTHRLVERPLGRRRHEPPWRVILPALTLTAVGAWGLQTWIADLTESRQVLLAQAAVASPTHPGAGAFSGADVPAQAPIVPDLQVIRDDVPRVYGQGCVQSHRDVPQSAEFTVCGDDSPGTAATILVTGGSHATMWLPAWDLLARENDWNILVAEKGGCQLTATGATTPDPQEVPPHGSCIDWNTNAVDEIVDLQPDAVFTIGTTTRAEIERVPDGFTQAWARLAARGVPVIAIRDIARTPEDVPTCLDREGLDARAAQVCGQARDRVLKTQSPLETSDGIPENVTTLDLTDHVCTDRRCPAIVGNVIVLRDHSHFTTAYARSLAPALDARLREGAPWLYR